MFAASHTRVDVFRADTESRLIERYQFQTLSTFLLLHARVPTAIQQPTKDVSEHRWLLRL